MALRLRDDITLADTEYGLVLLDKKRGQYWGINNTGALALKTLLSGGTPTDAAKAVASQYRVPPTTAQADIETLLQELLAEELIQS